jgi:hypothetical protein
MVSGARCKISQKLKKLVLLLKKNHPCRKQQEWLWYLMRIAMDYSQRLYLSSLSSRSRRS